MSLAIQNLNFHSAASFASDDHHAHSKTDHSTHSARAMNSDHHANSAASMNSDDHHAHSAPARNFASTVETFKSSLDDSGSARKRFEMLSACCGNA